VVRSKPCRVHRWSGKTDEPTEALLVPSAGWQPGWRRLHTLTAVTFTTAHLPSYLRGALASDQARPRITFYDDSTGERAELSALTLANWVTKTMNLLITDVGVEPQARVSLHLPWHWLGAVWAIAIDAVGAELVVDDLGQPVDVAVVGPEGVNTHQAKVDHGLFSEAFAVSMAPMAMPLGGPNGPPLPPGTRDFCAEVRLMPDQIVMPPDAVGGSAERAVARAAALGLRAGDRVAVLDNTRAGETDVVPVSGYVDGLIAPLSVDGSVVWTRNPDSARCVTRWEAEQVSILVGPIPDGVVAPDQVRRAAIPPG